MLVTSGCCCCRTEARQASAACVLRYAMERAVEEMLANVQALIGSMDLVDGDAEREPDGDAEPDADREPDVDLEPTLGWTPWGGSAGAWVSDGGVAVVDVED